MENTNKPKVVFTYVEAGFGHMMPAKAVSDAFKRKYSDKCEIVDWNIFSDSDNPIVQNYAKKLFGWTKSVANNKFLFFVEAFSYMIGSKATLRILDARFKKAKKIMMDEISVWLPSLKSMKVNLLQQLDMVRLKVIPR